MHKLSHFFDETLDLYSAARLEIVSPQFLRVARDDTEYTKSGSITLTERVWIDQGGDWDDSMPSWTAEFGPWRRDYLTDSDSDS